MRRSSNRLNQQKFRILALLAVLTTVGTGGRVSHHRVTSDVITWKPGRLETASQSRIEFVQFSADRSSSTALTRNAVSRSASPDSFRTLIRLLAILGFVLLSFTLWFWALLDCATTETPGKTRRVWLLIVLLLHAIGALLYLRVRRPRRIRKSGRWQR